MKAKVLIGFYDIVAKRDRKPGDEFEVTAERAEDINSAGLGKLVEVVEVETKAVKKPETKTVKKDA